MAKKSYEDRKRELSERSIEIAKKHGQDTRKRHEHLTKKGQTALDNAQVRSYEKHLVKKGVMHRPKNPASHFNY